MNAVWLVTFSALQNEVVVISSDKAKTPGQAVDLAMDYILEKYGGGMGSPSYGSLISVKLSVVIARGA